MWQAAATRRMNKTSFDRAPPRGRVSPVFRFVFFLGVLALLASCEEKHPHISSIEPRIGEPGDTLTIYGEYFGQERGDSYITIAGVYPTASAYSAWSDTVISLRLPEHTESGLVYVYALAGKSNAALFSIRATIPEPARNSASSSTGPVIESIQPAQAAVGQLITIYGSGFGAFRESGGVFFAWNAENRSPDSGGVPEVPEIEVFDSAGYETWSDREIRLHVPDGAINGNLEVRTVRGNSKPVYFEVSGRPGSKVFKDKRNYVISYSVDIWVEEASSPNSLYLWMPRPVTSSSQRESHLLSRNREPFVEEYRGTSLFKLTDLQPGATTRLSLSHVIDVYAVETTIREASVKQSYTTSVAEAALDPTALIPADDPRITAQAAAIIARERNPYLKARLIYQWLIQNGGIQDAASGARSGGALEALENGNADAYQAALLFCALARASGVPAIPVAGVLVDRQRQAASHYWAEFWIEDFGWIPVDPALGAGAAPESAGLREDHDAYYFGNMDNQHVAFSRGETTLSRMTPYGRTAARPRGYALQSLWEEATGDLGAYSSLWSDVTVTGMYAN
jgi:transglutaminase-like putative cysteine protease